jgi:hypothetical protein
MSNETVKLGQYEVLASKKANINAIEFLVGSKLLPAICTQAKVKFKIEKVVSKRGNEYEKVVGKTKADNVKVNQLRGRIKASLFAHFGESEIGYMTNADIIKLGKAKALPKAIAERIELDFDTVKTTAKPTPKTTKVSAKVKTKTTASKQGKKYTLSQLENIAEMMDKPIEDVFAMVELQGGIVVNS